MVTGTTQKKEVISIFDTDNVGIGFIVRRQVVFGGSDIGHLWCATPELLGNKGWYGAFETRREAINYLQEVRLGRTIEMKRRMT